MADAAETSSSISHYVLYGEQHADEDPEFVHIEDIRSRSRLYEWQITPHTHHRMFQIVYLSEGSSGVRLDRDVHHVEAPCAVCVPGGVVHGFHFEPETVGWVLTIAELLLIDARYRRSRKLFEPLFREPSILSFDDNPEDAALIVSMFTQMHKEFQWPRMGRDAMFEWMTRVVLMTIRRHQESHAPAAAPVGRRELFAKFRHLVEDHYREHRPVAAYADELALSQARLNRLCKAFAGKGAGDLIQDRLTLEAQRHLIYTSAPASMIAYELGFQDPAYFSRFFKRRTGMAPGEYRDSKLADHMPLGGRPEFGGQR